MRCDLLPTTGLSTPLVAVLAIALCCVVVGTLVVVARARHRRGALGALLLVLVLAVSVGPGLAAAPAQAAASGCVQDGADGRLTVTQTSTMDGLAPGVAPAPITGLLVNVSTDRTVVAAVDVEILSVVPAGTGACSAEDYTVVDPRMRVDETLQGGASTTFEGASIGFRSSAENQDACQGATVRLLYTVVPG